MGLILQNKNKLNSLKMFSKPLLLKHKTFHRRINVPVQIRKMTPDQYDGIKKVCITSGFPSNFDYKLPNVESIFFSTTSITRKNQEKMLECLDMSRVKKIHFNGHQTRHLFSNLKSEPNGNTGFKTLKIVPDTPINTRYNAQIVDFIDLVKFSSTTIRSIKMHIGLSFYAPNKKTYSFDFLLSQTPDLKKLNIHIHDCHAETPIRNNVKVTTGINDVLKGMLHLRKLKTLELCFSNDPQNKVSSKTFKQILENNRDTLRHLTIKIYQTPGNQTEVKDCFDEEFSFAEEFKKLKKLESVSCYSNPFIRKPFDTLGIEQRNMVNRIVNKSLSSFDQEMETLVHDCNPSLLDFRRVSMVLRVLNCHKQWELFKVFMLKLLQIRRTSDDSLMNSFMIIPYMVNNNEIVEMFWKSIGSKKLKRNMDLFLHEIIRIRKPNANHIFMNIKRELIILYCLFRFSGVKTQDRHRSGCSYIQLIYFYFNDFYKWLSINSKKLVSSELNNRTPIENSREIPKDSSHPSNEETQLEPSNKRRKMNTPEEGEQENMAIHDILPNELMMHIFSFLSDWGQHKRFTEGMVLTMVCKQWRNIYLLCLIDSFKEKDVVFFNMSNFHKKFEPECEQLIIEENKRIIEKEQMVVDENKISKTKIINAN